MPSRANRTHWSSVSATCLTSPPRHSSLTVVRAAACSSVRSVSVAVNSHRCLARAARIAARSSDSGSSVPGSTVVMGERYDRAVSEHSPKLVPMPTAPARAPKSTPRTLAEDLRARADEDLRALFAARPDLAAPLPTSSSALATRATTRASTQRALERLDTPLLQVAEVLTVLPDPTSVTAVSKAWGAKAGDVVAELRRRALVWGPDRRLHLVSAVRELLGPHPAGLGPSLADALGRRSPQRLAELLEDLGLEVSHDPEVALARLAEHLAATGTVETLLEGAPDGVRAVLDKLTWGPPTGAVERADRQVRAASASGPVEWLLSHGLLAVSGPGTVVLPREVGLALRGGRVHRSAERTAPELTRRNALCRRCSRPRPRPPPKRAGWSPSSAAGGARPARRCCGRAAWACGTCAGRRPRWRSTTPRRRSSSRRRGWPGSSPTTARSNRAGCRRRRSTRGWRRSPGSAG